MSIPKYITALLLIAFCSCKQKTQNGDIAARVENFNARIIPLTRYIDNIDSCKKAVSFLDSATALDKACFICYSNKVMFLNTLKDYDKIISTINNLLRIRPNAHDMYLSR